MYPSVIKPYLVSLISGLLLWCSLPVYAQSSNFSVKEEAVDSILTAKNFPLLSLLEQNNNWKHIIRKDAVLQRLSAAQYKRVKNALQACKDVSCYAASLQWSPDDMNAAGTELIHLYQKKKSFRSIVPALKKEGSYPLYETLADTAFLRAAWKDAARGMNYMLDVYIKGKLPRYSKIDAIDFAPGDTAFENRVHYALNKMVSASNKAAFFRLPLQAALFALQINGRDEAARYEPLKGGMNKLPFSKISATKWAAYPYSLILVPGLGPETPGVALDPGGAKRCEEAVVRFRKGLAPFIVVSGGHVHPNKTPYCEAVEMKKYMVEQLGIPDSVVFIEPHARHTTTNIRNVSRMIFRFGIPSDMPVLIVTDSSQNNYIVKGMTKTALRDLGYLPYQKIKQLNNEEVEFYPVLNSLQADPFDPLDP